MCFWAEIVALLIGFTKFIICSVSLCCKSHLIKFVYDYFYSGRNAGCIISDMSANWKLPSLRIALGERLFLCWTNTFMHISPLSGQLYFTRDQFSCQLRGGCASITSALERPTDRPTSLIVNYRVQNSFLATDSGKKTCAHIITAGKNQHHLPAHQVQKRQLFDKYLQLAVRA